MATIAQIVAQIRTAVYGRDVRENIAQGIEKCYTDVTSGKTAANAAADAANAAASNVQTAISNANTAANAANTAVGSVGTAITNAETATGAANTAANAISNMTVATEGLAPNTSPTVAISTVSGHKHILFGIPKGDTGNTPDISIGSVTTGDPTQEASVSIGGTADQPTLNFVIPRGYDGPSVMSNRIWDCSTYADVAAKIVSVTTENFELEEGGLYIINIENKNTADNPTLNIESTGDISIRVNGDAITNGYEKSLLSGICLFIYDGTYYNLIGNFYNESAQAIPDSNIDELFT